MSGGRGVVIEHLGPKGTASKIGTANLGKNGKKGDKMKTIYIYCEGPTEDSFLNTVLYPHFFALGIYVRPIVCETRRDANRKYRGGVSRYAKKKMN